MNKTVFYSPDGNFRYMVCIDFTDGIYSRGIAIRAPGDEHDKERGKQISGMRVYRIRGRALAAIEFLNDFRIAGVSISHYPINRKEHVEALQRFFGPNWVPAKASYNVIPTHLERQLMNNEKPDKANLRGGFKSDPKPFVDSVVKNTIDQVKSLTIGQKTPITSSKTWRKEIHERVNKNGWAKNHSDIIEANEDEKRRNRDYWIRQYALGRM
ncbi:MAG: hypothetical protein H7831_17950 [Magnetococcus sp. WYHC-3]